MDILFVVQSVHKIMRYTNSDLGNKVLLGMKSALYGISIMTYIIFVRRRVFIL